MRKAERIRGRSRRLTASLHSRDVVVVARRTGAGVEQGHFIRDFESRKCKRRVLSMNVSGHHVCLKNVLRTVAEEMICSASGSCVSLAPVVASVKSDLRPSRIKLS